MADAFEIEGLPELIDTLAALPEQMGKNALERAGKRALVPFLSVVKDIAPVDDPADTPERPAYALRESYIISTKLNARQAKMARRAGKHYAEVYAGTNDPRGAWHEFGYFAGGHTWVPPQPHVSVAWNVTGAEVMGEAAVALSDELDRALTRAVRRA